MASFRLNNVSLSYRVFSGGERSVTSAVKSIATGGVIRHTNGRNLEIQALRDIQLRAGDGDRVGVIGHNGAGKTSLLKVIAGIYRPQQGSIERRGKTVAVINPAVGLDPMQTGYENIETIGLLSGLSWPQIRAAIPDIEAFTELGEFLSLPVSSYSAGMKARLAFAVATSLNPEILIADENLATGDAHFVQRARQRMQDMMEKSSILVLASHSLSTLRQLCNRAILMDHGQIVADGEVEEVVGNYQNRLTASGPT